MMGTDEWVNVLEYAFLRGRFSVRLRAVRTTHVYLAGVKGEQSWLLHPLSGQHEVQAGTEALLQGESPQAPERLVLVAQGGPYNTDEVLRWVLSDGKGVEGTDPNKGVEDKAPPLSVL